MENRTIICDDNLNVLRSMESESVDLIYLDPPFNKKMTFQGKVGSVSVNASFLDNYHLKELDKKVQDEVSNGGHRVFKFLRCLIDIERKKYNVGYLIYMAIRILECYRVLKKTGSFYLHCDPTSSHYLKLICDLIFFKVFFRNEIIWKRTSTSIGTKMCLRNIHDVILFYSKSNDYVWHNHYALHGDKYVNKFNENKTIKSDLNNIVDYSDVGSIDFTKYIFSSITAPFLIENEKEWRGYDPKKNSRSWFIDKKMIKIFIGEEKAKIMTTNEKLEVLYQKGQIAFSDNGVPRIKFYLGMSKGVPFQSIIDDISIRTESECTGYPTQKPIALLERFIKASTNEGDLVFDGFCGSGTTCVAAEKLRRRWIGVDISKAAYEVIKYRLSKEVNDKEDLFKKDIKVSYKEGVDAK